MFFKRRKPWKNDRESAKVFFMKILLMLVFFFLLSSCEKGNNSQDLIPASALNFQTFNLPSSTFHNPNSTWWGYNMSKIVRDHDSVYVGIIENDTQDTRIKADFNVYKVDPSGVKTLVGSHKTSRPGNILVSSSGALHVFVLDPTDPTSNDSIGNLVYYSYPNARSNDFSTKSSEIIRSVGPGNSETVNIRMGATINGNDTLAVGYGLNYESSTSSRAMVIFTKTTAGSWEENIYGGLMHEYYYPYLVLTNSEKMFVLPVQDDYVPGPNPYNRYYKSPIMFFNGTNWSQQMLLDLSKHPLAINDDNTQLVEQTELFETSNGNVIGIVIDKTVNWGSYRFKKMILDSSGNQISLGYLSWPSNKSLRWIRAFEIDSELYYLGVSSDGKAYFVQDSSSKIVRVSIPSLNQAYVYLSSGRGGAHQDHDYLDILSVSGNSDDYPSPGMKLHKISKAAIKALF